MKPGPRTVARRRAIAIAAALLAMAGVALIVLRPGAAQPPADAAAGLVPADALVYVHLSTDEDRDQDGELLERLERFPSFSGVRRTITDAVQRQGGIDLRRDVLPWLGKEAAFALLPSGGTVAPSLLLLSVADAAGAKRALARASRGGTSLDYRGTEVRRFRSVAAALIKDFLVLGQEPAVKAALDRAGGRGSSLAASRRFREARATAPDDRALDAYLSPEGVRRVLRPLPGLAGVAGAAIDDPALEGAGVTLSPDDDGLRLQVRALRSRGQARTFTPELVERVDEDSFAYLGLGGLDALTTLFPRVGLDRLLERARAALPAESGVDLERDVLGPLRGEVAVSARPALPLPQVTLIARTRDEAKTRDALGRLQGVLAEALAPAGESGGSVPTFEERRLDGVTAYAISLGPGFELLYAVADGLLIVSNSGGGIERAREERDRITDDDAFKDAVGELSPDTEALLFLDLRQLLTLGDLAGLTKGGALQTARDDLRRLRILGAAARREGDDTIAEFFLEIP